ncbi:IncF plasmid conjugative transfer pilus assembly protein TraB [Salmonella enterica subsp. arizonae]|nr:IncF plasmid conjugative transfer pilus assembly protein TraB [Salmonella enterica subsp. arizonae]
MFPVNVPSFGPAQSAASWGDDNIDQKIAGHVSFMGKNGIKGEVVMRNGQILLYAGGAGFLDGIGEGH